VTETDPETMSAEERRSRGLARLPQSLGEALDALEVDAAVRRWFPPPLYEAYSRYKRWELEYLGKLPPEEQCRLYLEAY
jgi:glutamine synthetase